MNFTLTTLGVSSASPMSDRYPSAHVLDVHGRLFLLDCGEGTQILMSKHRISHFKISDICISHLHGDHVFGLFGLLSTMSMKGRTAPVNIYAPLEMAAILDFYKKQFGEDILFEIRHIRTDYPDKTLIAETDNLEIRSFPLEHSLPCWGFLFKEKKRSNDFYRKAPKSFAYCLDTAPFSREAEYISGVNLLLHETTFASDMEEIARKTGHSTTHQAASVAKTAGVEKMVITHFSSRYHRPEILLEQVKEIFENAFLASEGEKFVI